MIWLEIEIKHSLNVCVHLNADDCEARKSKDWLWPTFCGYFKPSLISSDFHFHFHSFFLVIFFLNQITSNQILGIIPIVSISVTKHSCGFAIVAAMTFRNIFDNQKLIEFYQFNNQNWCDIFNWNENDEKKE